MSANPSPFDTSYDSKRVLVTGATSGLGFEAAAQLAELGYGSVVITGRTADKAAAAKRELTTRTGRDVFDTLAVDVGSVASSSQAAAELIDRGPGFDALILNAGMVPSERNVTVEGLEVCFSSSLVGHHILTTQLIEAGLLNDGARVVIVGSEAANNDLPKAMGMTVSPFAVDPTTDGEAFKTNLKSFAKGDHPSASSYNPNTQYATTKVVSAWWAADMQRRNGNRFSFFNVSPGANMGTDAARHTTGAFKIMISVMGRFGHLFGMNQPTEQGAKRYVDVVTGGSAFRPGGTYTSKPKKMVGDLVVRSEAHLVDPVRQNLAIAALDELVAEVGAAHVE